MKELKIISSGNGFRITNRGYGHSHRTIIVRGPNSRRDNFTYSLIATEGIAGRPQMTFDSYESAQAWLDAHQEEFSERLFVGPIRGSYSCYKVPLADGSECGLDESNFPHEGDVEGGARYEREGPEYFGNSDVEAIGFFNEDLNEDLIDDSEDVERIVNDENLTPEQKAEKLGGKPLDYVIRAVDMNYIAKFQPREAPEGIHGDNGCYRCGVRSVFIARGHANIRFSEEPDPILASWIEYCSENADRRRSSIKWGGDVMDSIVYGEMRGLQPIEKVGFFNERLEKINTRNVYKIKTRGTRGYSIKVNKPNSRHDTFDISVYRLNPYGNAAGWSQIYFPTGSEATAWLDNFKRTNPVYRDYNFYVYNTTLALPSDLIKVPLEDGSEAWMHKLALPPIDSPQGRHFEELYPDYFRDEVRRGFFTENMITEAYSQLRDEILRVILDYVRKNGYIRGTWNGRYATPSPTVEEINAILRHSGNLEDHQCEHALVDQFKEWFASKPKNNDGLIKCEQALEKEAGGGKDELKAVVALASLFYSEQAYQQRQIVKAERQRQHQDYIDSPENSGAGEVGQEVSFIISSVKNILTEYGVLCDVVGTDGRHYIFKYAQESMLQPGYKVSGRIRRLDEFRGIKQTRLGKVQVEQNPEASRAFFTE